MTAMLVRQRDDHGSVLPLTPLYRKDQKSSVHVGYYIHKTVVCVYKTVCHRRDQKSGVPVGHLCFVRGLTERSTVHHGP